jgi:hypothetical protein
MNTGQGSGIVKDSVFCLKDLQERETHSHIYLNYLRFGGNRESFDRGCSLLLCSGTQG